MNNDLSNPIRNSKCLVAKSKHSQQRITQLLAAFCAEQTLWFQYQISLREKSASFFCCDKIPKILKLNREKCSVYYILKNLRKIRGKKIERERSEAKIIDSTQSALTQNNHSNNDRILQRISHILFDILLLPFNCVRRRAYKRAQSHRRVFSSSWLFLLCLVGFVGCNRCSITSCCDPRRWPCSLTRCLPSWLSSVPRLCTTCGRPIRLSWRSSRCCQSSCPNR